MNKLTLLFLLSISLLVIGKAYAVSDAPHQTQYIFLDSAVGAYSTDMEFPPEVPQTFSNPLFWTVNAQCTIESTESSTLITAKVKKGTGHINGQELTSNMPAETFIVHNKDVLNISADGGAVVEMVNKGSQIIKAHCSI